MSEDPLRSFRALVVTKIKIAERIPEYERLLAVGGRVALQLKPLIDRRMTTLRLSSAPDEARPELEAAADKFPVFGLLTHCLLFGSDHRLKHDDTIDFDALFSEWIAKSATATSAIRRYNRGNEGVPAAIFRELFKTDVEPVQERLGVGWWRRFRTRATFQNVYSSGVLLGMLYDIAAKRASETKTSR